MIREDFLHFLWKHQLFDQSRIKTIHGATVVVHSPGQYLQRSGPDFFFGIIEIDGQRWAGNIEIHVKSSDWYEHHHEIDPAYENVILHVVWTHDIGVFRKDHTEIPVLELKPYIASDYIEKYGHLIKPKQYVYCEPFIKELPDLFVTQFTDRLLIDRLEKKTRPIEELLLQHKNDWEAVFFIWLARGFGLNVNGESFAEMAASIPFSAIRNERAEVQNLEALLFSRAGFLLGNELCSYQENLRQRSQYLFAKYNLTGDVLSKPDFFQLRPDNFPTIRLAQLAYLYNHQDNLLSTLLEADTLEHFYKIFQTGVSTYWESHYHFGKAHLQKRKRLTKEFIDLLLINTVIPFKFIYYKAMSCESSHVVLNLLLSIKAEKNNVITQFNKLGLSSKNAFESQALLHLKSDYCNKKRCLECQIGISFLHSDVKTS